MSMRLRIILIVAVLVVGGGVVGVGALMLKADQDAAIAQYGEAVIALCKNGLDSDADGDMPDGAKVVFIDASTSTISSAYQPNLSAVYAATGKADVTHVACVKSADALYDVVEYGSTGRYKCRQHLSNLEIGIFDVKTGKQIAFRQVEGATPPECPERTDKNLDKYGSPPVAAEVFDALGIS